jgi:site-specific DNA-methyltransferase (adenine-specific)
MKEKIFLLDNQTLILGDCLDVLNTFPDEHFDVVVTSPPYNIGINYHVYKDRKTFTDYLSWIYVIFSDIKRVLKKDGSIFLNIGSTSINPWIPSDVSQTLRPLFVLQNHIIWVKSISIGQDSFGHYKPINSDRYTNHTFENIFHFTKDGTNTIDRKSIGVPYVYKCNLKAKTVTEDLRCRGNCWFIPYETIQSKNDRGNHPAIFPETLVEWCIKLHGKKENIKILDPFCGSGTVLLVSRKLKFIGTGIEIDEKYFDYAKDQLEKETLI